MIEILGVTVGEGVILGVMLGVVEGVLLGVTVGVGVGVGSVIANTCVAVSRVSVIVVAVLVSNNVHVLLSTDPYSFHPTGSRGVSSFAVTQSYASNVISVVLSMNKLDDPWVPGATLPPVV